MFQTTTFSAALLLVMQARPGAGCDMIGSAAALKLPAPLDPPAPVSSAPGADTAPDTLNMLTGIKLLSGGTVSEWELDAAISGTVAAGIWKPVGQNFELVCVDLLQIIKPGFQALPGSCSFEAGDVIGIGCKGPGVVTMFGQSDQGVGAGIVQWSGMPALNKVGETTATAPTPGNRDCCISRQYALRIKACSGWGWTFIIVLAAASVLYVGGGVGYGVKAKGADPGIQAHPHISMWKESLGLVQDGAKFVKAALDEKMKGGTAAAAAADDGEDGLLGGSAEKADTPPKVAAAVKAPEVAAPALVGGSSSSSSDDDDVVE